MRKIQTGRQGASPGTARVPGGGFVERTLSVKEVDTEGGPRVINSRGGRGHRKPQDHPSPIRREPPDCSSLVRQPALVTGCLRRVYGCVRLHHPAHLCR